MYYTGVIADTECFYKIKEGIEDEDIFWTQQLEKVVATNYLMT